MGDLRLSEKVPFYNHSFVFDFEKEFVLKERTEWLHERLFIPIILGILYVGLLLNGPEMMRHRRPFDLRVLFTLWNTMFAIVSFCGTFRLMPELVRSLKEYGLYHSVCNSKGFVDDPVIGCWLWIMAYCKVGQLVDTVFIVLKKKEVTFLHGYHHFTDLYAAAYSSIEVPAQGRWFVTINYLVHAVMNTYFVFRTMKVKMPELFPKFVTAIQVVQMAIGVYISWFTLDMIKRGYECDIANVSAKLCLSWFIVSLVLFSTFYYQKYIALPKSKKSIDKEN